MNKQVIIAVVLFFCIGVAALLGVSQKEEQKELPVGATGSRFSIGSLWLQASSTSVLTPSLSESPIATTSPVFIVGGSTTTVTHVSNGISDVRVNLSAKSTTTNPAIIIRREVQSQDDTQFFPLGTITGITVGEDADTVWNVATNTNLLVTDSAPPTISFQFSNTNAAEIRYSIGASSDVELSVEFQRAIPN